MIKLLSIKIDIKGIMVAILIVCKISENVLKMIDKKNKIFDVKDAKEIYFKVSNNF